MTYRIIILYYYSVTLLLLIHLYSPSFLILSYFRALLFDDVDTDESLSRGRRIRFFNGR